MKDGRDRYRTLTAAAVLLVALIAAVVSYLHIVNLALRYGQEPVAAYLLPLSIDGMVGTSSLAMLRSARLGLTAPWLARAGLVLAVAATLAANVASGIAHGWPGALLAGWPAVAFIVSAETAISMSRTRPENIRAANIKPTAAAAKRTPARTSKSGTETAIRSALTADPDMSNKDLAAAASVSERHARRVRARLAAAST